MTAFSDLPNLVVKRINQLARARSIRGTNKYARVSQRWRDASSSTNNEDLDPLQLFLDPRHLTAEDIGKASSWMAMHGQQVQALVVEAMAAEPERLNWLPDAAAGLSHLKQLQVDHPHSLVLLAPVLGQLPQLQHLAAQVDIICEPSQLVHTQNGGVVNSVFVNHQGAAWEDVPHLQQLCPHLTSLYLEIKESASCERRFNLQADVRLPRLLPAALQELCLQIWCGGPYHGVLPSTSLVHLTALQRLSLRYMRLSMQEEGALAPLAALQQLTLYGVEGDGPGLWTLAQDLSSLQQLRVPYSSGRLGKRCHAAAVGV
jgi:hypothetical protein